ncbi:hypothetical protein [Neisseria sp. 74A18]|uniref:hypothetical protein n=1 Tax=Neisseria sp. 74A18 TaxID=1696094 RepID=UPI000AB478F1|nr:hypothetical protein [Neisseria sp. 74A18]
MNMKDGFFVAIIAALTSVVLWSLNYFVIEKPRIKLDEQRMSLDMLREQINQKDKEISLKEKQMQFMQDGVMLVKVEKVECYKIRRLSVNTAFIWYECSFVNKSKRPVSTHLKKENFSLEQFNGDKFIKYKQDDKYLYVDEIVNVTNITPDGSGIIRFRLGSKDKKYQISSFLSNQQIVVNIPFAIDRLYIDNERK